MAYIDVNNVNVFPVQILVGSHLKLVTHWHLRVQKHSSFGSINGPKVLSTKYWAKKQIEALFDKVY